MSKNFKKKICITKIILKISLFLNVKGLKSEKYEKKGQIF